MGPRWLRGLVVLLAVAACASAACRKPRRHVLSKKQIQAIQAATLLEAPTPGIVVGARFDDLVELVGVDLPKGPVVAGKSTEITWYWRSLAEAPGEWMIFVHIEADGRRSTHDHHGVGELHPISRWKVGDIIRDKQKITLPADFPEGTVRVRVGIFDEGAWRDRRQNRRMAVTNADVATVKADGEQRVEVGSFTVEAASKDARDPKTARKYDVYRITEAPVLDGKLTDPAWRSARSTQAFVTPHGKKHPTSRSTHGRMTWTQTHLYVGITCRDDDITNDQTGRDTTLWEQDVVEVYLDPGADGKDYVELQVSPTGELFDAWFVSRRKPDWPQAAKALHMEGFEAAIDARGSINKRDDGVKDRSWTAEIAIPFAELPGIDGPPAEGVSWGFNLYRIDGKTPTRGPHMSAWSPAGGDFHDTSGFGKITFRGERKRASPRLPRPLPPVPAPAPTAPVPTPAPTPPKTP